RARRVEVLDDQDARLGDAGDVAPDVGHADARGAGRAARADQHGGGVADHRAELRQDAADLRTHEAMGVVAQLEGLDRVADGGARDLAQLRQGLWAHRWLGHVYLPSRRAFGRTAALAMFSGSSPRSARSTSSPT